MGGCIGSMSDPELSRTSVEDLAGHARSSTTHSQGPLGKMTHPYTSCSSNVCSLTFSHEFFDGIVRGDVVAADAIDSLSDDDFEAALVRLFEIERAVEATELHFLDSARRRGSQVRHGFRDTAAWVASLAGERIGAVRRDVARWPNT